MITTGAGATRRLHHHMADLASIVGMTSINMAVGKNAGTQPGSDIKINKGIQLFGHTVKTLADSHHCGVILQSDR